MRTPYGAECKHYYADFNRGRNIEECRLPRRDSEKWTPDLCKACPVPKIRLANACQHLTLTGKIDRGFLGLNRKMTVTAACPKANGPVAEPAIGCGHCQEDLPALKFTLDE
ncbi:MAG TPA: hypothetical protein VI547_05355 [Anaerolineales bacterium]|nr:hypothetical protein [Anaerolineales bacterium]